MRIIRIICDGQPIDVYDSKNQNVDEASKELVKMMDSDKIMRLVGKNSAAIVRPSSISGINIIDSDSHEPPAYEMQQISVSDSVKNVEQNTDMITDMDDEEGES